MPSYRAELSGDADDRDLKRQVEADPLLAFTAWRGNVGGHLPTFSLSIDAVSETGARSAVETLIKHSPHALLQLNAEDE